LKLKSSRKFQAWLSCVILKNNAPRYLVIDFSKADDSAVAKDEDVLEISKRLLAQNKEAYEVLAK